MEGEELLIEQKDKIAFLYINRPKKFNALNISLLNKFNSVLKEILDIASVFMLGKILTIRVKTGALEL